MLTNRYTLTQILTLFFSFLFMLIDSFIISFFLFSHPFFFIILLFPFFIVSFPLFFISLPFFAILRNSQPTTTNEMKIISQLNEHQAILSFSLIAFFHCISLIVFQYVWLQLYSFSSHFRFYFSLKFLQFQKKNIWWAIMKIRNLELKKNI